MEIFNTITEIRAKISLLKSKNSSIGFVPTMGALHRGHFSLIQQAKKENDICICSIFVNPTQFNNIEDYEKYPNTLDQDLKKLKELNCNIAFCPPQQEIYNTTPATKFNYGQLESVMEGRNRPGHFNGVSIIISKFFNIVEPTKAYFGQKDIQQYAIISQLVNDLSFNIKLECCSTVREKDGLAMSSRNIRLNQNERNNAPLIHQTLQKVVALLSTLSPNEAIEEAKKDFITNNLFQLEYLEVVDFKTLQPISKLIKNKKYAVCIAIFLGEIRLIDNIII